MIQINRVKVLHVPCDHHGGDIQLANALLPYCHVPQCRSNQHSVHPIAPDHIHVFPLPLGVVVAVEQDDTVAVFPCLGLNLISLAISAIVIMLSSVNTYSYLMIELHHTQFANTIPQFR